VPRRRNGGWRGPQQPGEFPTLGYQVAELIQAKCVIPDGDYAGEPYALTDEMLWFLLAFYRVDPDAKWDSQRGRWRRPFVYGRGGQLVRPQKWGKGPFSAAMICAEADADAPVLFDGWDAHGEPVGRPWATPWIQVAALSEDQTDNVWSALVPMITRGALHVEMPDTGVTRINLPRGGKIEPVTSSAGTRLGQRITFAVQDQPELWTKRNGGRDVADTQRRNLGGMGGRWLETPNAWDPRDQSVAQQTSEGQEPGVLLDDVDPGPGSVRNKTDRRRMLNKVYGDSWWVDLDRIDDEITALLKRDPAQAERYYLNRKRADEGAAFDIDRWKELADTELDVADGSLIVVFVDGARFVDALGIVATDVETGHQWPLGVWERPEAAPDNYEHDSDEIDGALLEAFERYDVWRLGVDPQWIEHLLERWQGRWGPKRVLPWYTNRPRQVAWAVRNYTDAIGAGDVSHNGHETFTRHIANARKQKLDVFDDKHRQMHTISKESPDSPLKIDLAMAAVGSWEFRGDCIAAGKPRSPGKGEALFL
jgi:hypothetical protein